MRQADPEYYNDTWTREDHRAKAFDHVKDINQLRDDLRTRQLAWAQLHATLALSAPSQEGAR